MMITREIPPALWRRALDDLSRLHAGASVRLVVLDNEHGPQTHGDAFTLVGLTSDGDTGSQSISAILAGSVHINHIISQPRSLHLELLWESRTANVQIADRNGARTLICLGPPVLPDVTKPPLPVPPTAAGDATREPVEPSRALMTWCARSATACNCSVSNPNPCPSRTTPNAKLGIALWPSATPP